MKEFAGNIKLRILLYIMQRIIHRGQRGSARIQQLLGGDPFVLQIKTARGVGGYFIVKHGTIRLMYGVTPNPDFCMIWRDGHDALRSMASSDETELLRSFESGQCRMQGSFLVAMWLNEVMKIARQGNSAIGAAAL
jgi:hypothetical protein